MEGICLLQFCGTNREPWLRRRKRIRSPLKKRTKHNGSVRFKKGEYFLENRLHKVFGGALCQTVLYTNLEWISTKPSGFIFTIFYKIYTLSPDFFEKGD